MSRTMFRFRRSDLLAQLLVGVLVLVAGVRAAATHPVLSQTYDEPAHLATGMEWVDRGVYRYEPQHPPLSRIAVAVGPYLDGVRTEGAPGFWEEGNRLLEQQGRYMHTLHRARLGTLVFLGVAALVVWSWARTLAGPAGGVAAVALFTTTAPVLAHAGLATTDLALVATLPLAMVTFGVWLDEPGVRTAVGFGSAAALAVLAKLSTLLFLPVSLAAMLLAHRLAGGQWTGAVSSPRPDARVTARRLRTDAIAAGVVFALVVWLGYRFSLGALAEPSMRPYTTIDRLVGDSGRAHDLAYAVLEAPVVPAVELLKGIDQVRQHAAFGHKSYLLGDVRIDGWWYFFPVAILAKSPIALLLLAGAGAVVAVRERRVRGPAGMRVLAALAGVITAAMTSSINIGVRHVLPAYVLLSVLAALGVVVLWRWSHRRLPAGALVTGLLIAWQAIDSGLAHPDYLAYFNEAFRARADRTLIFSDLDWGQDTRRLAESLRRRRIDTVHLALNNGGARYEALGFPAIRRLQPFEPVAGWVAADMYALRMGSNQDIRVPVDAYQWLDAMTPVERIGPSVRLYFIRPDEAAELARRLGTRRQQWQDATKLAGVSSLP